ncbi:MAG TPA: hypothetical protein PKN80_00890 [bacterium]|nr:hypothetical protein [bacterium]
MLLLDSLLLMIMEYVLLGSPPTTCGDRHEGMTPEAFDRLRLGKAKYKKLGVHFRALDWLFRRISKSPSCPYVVDGYPFLKRF